MAPRKRNSSRPLSDADRDKQILAALDLRAEFVALGVNFTKDHPNASGYVDCYAVFRDESSPSAGANVFTGRYKDQGGQGENLSFWDFATARGVGGDWRAAREYYAAKVGMPPMEKNGATTATNGGGRSLTLPAAAAVGSGAPPSKPPSPPAASSPSGRPARNPLDQLSFLDWTPAYERLAKFWCLKHKPGATLEAIHAAGGRVAIYTTPAKVKYQVLALPVWDAVSLSSEPMTWIGYNLTGAPLPVFKKVNGKWKTEWLKKPKSFSPIGGGLIGRHGLDRLAAHASDPESNPIDVVWKTEGPTDLLALWSSIPPELRSRNPIVTNPGGASENIRQEVACLFTGLSVVIVHDADNPGELGAVKWLHALVGLASDVRHVRLPYEVQPKHGKDLRDFLLEGTAHESNRNTLQGLPVPQSA